MRTKLLLSLCVLAMCTGLVAQSQYYYSDAGKLVLQENPESFILFTKTAQDLQELSQQKTVIGFEKIQAFPHKKYVVVQSDGSMRSSKEISERLGIDKALIDAIPGFQLDDGFTLYPTHTVVFKLSSTDHTDAVMEYLSTYEVDGIEYKDDVYRVSIKNIEDAFPIANGLFETGLVRFSQPDFYAELTHYADPLYPDQFQMNNTGQTIDGVTGVNDMDCNAPEAWNISLGSSAITVAVIDDGLDAHEDLETSGGANRIVGGLTPANNGNGSPTSSGAHGVSCAGIIAASHNNIGVQGVAPLVDLLTVNIFFDGESTQDIADGITWAKNNGADVFSNSWGYTSCTAKSSW